MATGYMTWDYGYPGTQYPVEILQLEKKIEHFGGGGNPFTVESITVKLKFLNIKPRHTSNTITLTGYPQKEGSIGFFGGCADSGITKYLHLN